MAETPPIHCDSLYIAPRLEDIALSCGARLLRERAAGLRILAVTLFRAPGASPEAAQREKAVEALGLDRLALDLPPAAQRDPRHRAVLSLVRERHPADEEALHRAADVLTDLAHRTRARQVYAPLAVGGHIDRRLAHEAARSAFTSGDGRNVFLFEDRPDALVPGAVRLRLGQIGARLPPAAAEAAARDGAAAYVLRFHVGPDFRGEIDGRWERLRAAWTAFGQWRAGRSWHPVRALGPRMQPVTDLTGGEDLPRLRALEGGWRPRLARLASSYARRLGAEHAERYWLLLPPREADGQETRQDHSVAR